MIKFVYSEKATKFCEISTLILSTVHTDKSMVEILQNFVAFSEYMNFKEQDSQSFFQTILWFSSDSQNFEEYHCLNFTTIFCSSEYLICSKNLEFIYIFDQSGGSC